MGGPIRHSALLCFFVIREIRKTHIHHAQRMSGLIGY